MLDRLAKLIHDRPGLTATELARELHGDDGYHERVGGACRVLAQFGKVKRRGNGGPGDPYTYYPPERTADPSDKATAR